MSGFREKLQGLLKKSVIREKEKVSQAEPDYFTNQKSQLWYFLMNEIDGEDEDTSGNEESKANSGKRD